MRLVIQRVTEAAVHTEHKMAGQISAGLLILAGISPSDTDEDINWLCRKAVQMRVFNDAEGKMNRSVQDIQGGILLISQFTLLASTKKGNRPSFIEAAPPDVAIPLYDKLVKKLELELGKKIATGVFGANMQISLVNDGPVTILLDSKNRV